MSQQSSTVDDTKKQLKALKEWKQNIGLSAVLNAIELKKEIIELNKQNKSVQDELLKIQKECELNRQKSASLEIEKNNISLQLTEMHENKEKEEKLLSSEIAKCQIEIQKYKIEIENITRINMNLENELNIFREKNISQQMELDVFRNDLQKLELEKSEINIKLNEYKQNLINQTHNNEFLMNSVSNQDNQIQKDKNQFNNLQSQLKKIRIDYETIKKENNSLNIVNIKYKDLINVLTEKQNNMKYEFEQTQINLQVVNDKYNELSDKYEDELKQEQEAQNKVDQLQNQLDDMQSVQQSLAMYKSAALKTQKTQIGFRTMKSSLRISSALQSTLQIPTLNSINAYKSSRKILKMTLTSVMDVNAAGTSEALNFVMKENSPNSTVVYTDDDYDPVAFNDDIDDKERKMSNKSRKSSMSLYSVFSDDDGDIVDQASNEPYSNSQNISPDGGIDNINDAANLIPRKSAVDELLEIEIDKKSVDIQPQFNMKSFQQKLQEEIKKEMEIFEKELKFQYNKEFEIFKTKLIDEQEKEMLNLINAHIIAIQQIHEEYKLKLNNIDDNVEIIPLWQYYLAQILSI